MLQQSQVKPHKMKRFLLNNHENLRL